MKLSIADLQHVLDTYDKGVLSQGAHSPNDGAYCALECVSLARNHGTANFSDSPRIVGIPDLRAINDRLSDSIRTPVLLPLLAALSDWSVWAPARRQRWVAIVAIHTVNRIIAQLPDLPEYIVVACRQANTLTEAQAAASTAANAAAKAASTAAKAPAKAANAAASTAANAAANAANAADAAWMNAAANAADAAANAAASTAAKAAANAADAAWMNAANAANAASDKVLLVAVDIWFSAVAESESEQS